MTIIENKITYHLYKYSSQKIMIILTILKFHTELINFQFWVFCKQDGRNFFLSSTEIEAKLSSLFLKSGYYKKMCIEGAKL